MEQNRIESGALHKLSYGLFVLTARAEGKDNGCIINTCMQATSVPARISITVNKNNLTTEMIQKTGIFNVNVLSADTPYRVFEHFGLVSGREKNKFENCEQELRTENGLLYLSKFTNAVLSGRVIETLDCGTHLLFLAEVTEAKVCSNDIPVTYAEYFSRIKPKPQAAPAAGKIVGWRCRICNFVYEGETLPTDYACPICGHGPEDFEPIYE